MVIRSVLKKGIGANMQNQTYAESMERDTVPEREYMPVRPSARGMRRRPPGALRRTLGSGGGRTLARGLGLFSLGLGLAQLLLPRQVQRFTGICGDHEMTMRLMGLREIGHAALILLRRDPTAGVWTRLAGDALDLTGLGTAYASACHDQDRVGLATASVAGITALDALAAWQLSQPPRGRTRYGGRYAAPSRRPITRDHAFHVLKSITINRSPEMLYQYWRNFENLPRFMYHLQSVQVQDERRSHWVAKAPAGMQVAWDAEITEDRPNELIAWQSLPGADVPNSGRVRFLPGPAGRGTVVRVEIEYRPPGGALGKLVAKLFGEEPQQQVAGDLRRFKQVMETGEVVRSEGSPQGMGVHRQHPARPRLRSNGERRTSEAPEQPHATAAASS
jgi:uncharacterized membrane protein